MTLRYETQILEAYDRLGFKPRDRQVEYIDKICVAFIDDKITNVILSAPTGTGKSIIGAVVAEVVSKQQDGSDGSACASFMLTATNVLASQYYETFADTDDLRQKFLAVRGASHYECPALSGPTEAVTAESCAVQLFRKSSSPLLERYCYSGSCEYRESRRLRNLFRHLITNYAYYFIDRMYATNPMLSRVVTVFDEVHLLNDLFVEHCSVFLSDKRLAQLADDVSNQLQLADPVVFSGIKKLRSALTDGQITEENVDEYLKGLQAIYVSISTAAKVRATRLVGKPKDYVKMARMSKRYADMSCKIDDMFIFGFDRIFEYKPKNVGKGQNDHELTIKPIFVGKLFEVLHGSTHNLLMSATVSESYVTRTMELPGTTRFIQLQPQFPPQNKRVVFYKPQALNYSAMKDPQTVAKLCATITEIVAHHHGRQERGIILCPSFVVTEAVAKAIRAKRLQIEVFEHQRGLKLVDTLEAFKRHSGEAVLLTPSGFEGLDLPGDLSRYQIIVKAPFGSLGDKRVHHIATVYPDIYELITLMKIVQGAGRSVRSSQDHAVTYMLDTAIQRLWKNNPWAAEFSTSFTSVLGYIPE